MPKCGCKMTLVTLPLIRGWKTPKSKNSSSLVISPKFSRGSNFEWFRLVRRPSHVIYALPLRNKIREGSGGIKWFANGILVKRVARWPHIFPNEHQFISESHDTLKYTHFLSEPHIFCKIVYVITNHIFEWKNETHW